MLAHTGDACTVLVYDAMGTLLNLEVQKCLLSVETSLVPIAAHVVIRTV